MTDPGEPEPAKAGQAEVETSLNVGAVKPIPWDDSLSAFRFVVESQPLNPFDDARLKDLSLDRQQRERVAGWTIKALGIQLACMDAAFAWYAWHHVDKPEFSVTFRWFMVGTLGEIFAIMWVLVAYLFPRNRKSPYEGR